MSTSVGQPCLASTATAPSPACVAKGKPATVGVKRKAPHRDFQEQNIPYVLRPEVGCAKKQRLFIESSIQLTANMMASSPVNVKPTIVRVKRKASSDEEKGKKEESFTFPHLKESDIREGLPNKGFETVPAKRLRLSFRKLSISDTVDAKVGKERSQEKGNFDCGNSDCRIFSKNLPLLSEILPQAAAEIKLSMLAAEGNTAGDSLSATKEDEMNAAVEDERKYPWLPVDGEDDVLYCDPLRSLYESDDSDATEEYDYFPEDESSPGDEDESKYDAYGEDAAAADDDG